MNVLSCLTKPSLQGNDCVNYLSITKTVAVFVKVCHVVETLEIIEVSIISPCTLRNNDM